MSKDEIVIKDGDPRLLRSMCKVNPIVDVVTVKIGGIARTCYRPGLEIPKFNVTITFYPETVHRLQELMKKAEADGYPPVTKDVL